MHVCKKRPLLIFIKHTRFGKRSIVAKNNDGPQIPCVPAIILSKKIIQDRIHLSGATPCVGMITLEEYMKELAGFSIKQHVIIDDLKT